MKNSKETENRLFEDILNSKDKSHENGETYLNFLDDMTAAIRSVFKKYNFHKGCNFGKKEFDKVVEFLEIHDFFEEDIE